MIIIESRTKGINRPWPNDYNWITNQKKNQKNQSLTFSDFYSMISLKTFTDLGTYIRAL